MNVLARELRSCLSGLTVGTAGQYTAAFRFPPGFPGFAGHFPGNPILPGVCMVQAALVLIGARNQVPVSLKRIVSAKWFAPVRPGAELLFACREQRDQLVETTVRIRIACGDEKVADLHLQVLRQAAPKEGVS